MWRHNQNISGFAANARARASDNQFANVIDPKQVIESYAGPMAELDDQGRLIQANALGHAFIESVRTGYCDTLELSILLAQATLERRVTSGRVRLNASPQAVDESFGQDHWPHDPGLGAQTYDILILPCAGNGKNILLVAREITADANLMMALTASRALYRDLVNCQADFSWETDSHGAFIYVNQRGAFGYSASELNGLLVTELLNNASLNIDDLEGATPFTPNQPINDVEVWLKGKGNADICVLISALPVFDKNNSWRGARGVGRDVTELRKHEEEKQRSQRLNNAVSTVVTAMRVELDPRRIINSAAQATLQATGAHLAWTLRIDEKGRFHEGPETCAQAAAMSQNQCAVDWKPSIFDDFIVILKASLAQGEQRCASCSGSWDLLSVFTQHHGCVNGALIVARPKLDKGWDGEAIDLLTNVGAHAGIAIAQANQTELLQLLSSKDSLTGLMNRRAFMDLATQRMAHHIRHGCQAGFMYIDVDNFKKINDEFGHGQGDKLLVRISEDLRKSVRKSDLVVRLGGDEFGIFLEECDRQALQSKAEHILSLQSHKFVTPLPECAGELSLGIALFDPNLNENLDQLIHRADNALYAAKLKGKNQWALATPAIASQSSEKDKAITC